jgi:hypothetical protein
LDKVEAKGTQAFTNVGKKGRQEVRQLGFALQRMGIGGVAAFGEIFAALGPIGIAIGAIVISTLALIKVFKTLASIAIDAFKKVTSLGVEVAQELEIAGAQFRAVFQGNAEAAEAALNRVLKLSKQVGQNLVGVSRAFIPEVENLDQLEEILKIAAALAQFQPEQGILGARIALQEFLSGETRSLRRRFEVPQADIDRIKEAFDTRGIGGAIEELNDFLERTGRSLDDLADTSTVAFNRMKEGFRQLAGVFGEPIVAAAKEELDEFNSTIDDLTPTLEIIANALGEVVGQAIDLVGTEVEKFIENINFDNILEMVFALDGALRAFEVLIGQWGLGETAAGGFNSAIDHVTDGLFGLEAQFLRLAVASVELRAQFQDFIKLYAVLIKSNELFFGGAARILELVPGGGGENFAKPLRLVEDYSKFTREMAEDFADIDADIEDINKAIDDFTIRRGAFAVSVAKRLAAAQREDDTSDEDEADIILSFEQAERNLEETKTLIKEADKEIAEAREKFQAQSMLGAF